MHRLLAPLTLAFVLLGAAVPDAALHGTIPDGRTVSPVGYIVPLGYFPTASAISVDGKYLAILDQDSENSQVEIVDVHYGTKIVQHFDVPQIYGGVAWSPLGRLFVSGGYSGNIYSFNPAPKNAAEESSSGKPFVIGPTISAGGMTAGLAYDAASNHLFVARPFPGDVDEIDPVSGLSMKLRAATGRPYGVAVVGGTVFATLYERQAVNAWPSGATAPVSIQSGPRPTNILGDVDRVFVSNADGTDVVQIDAKALNVAQRFYLGTAQNEPPGASPGGLTVSDDRKTLFVTESGRNDIAVVDIGSGAVKGRIPTAWYPRSVNFVPRGSHHYSDELAHSSLYVVSAKGFGSPPNPSGEWDGDYTGILQHVRLTDGVLDRWTKAVAANNQLPQPTLPAAAQGRIRHVVFVVRENKTYDQVFGDLANTNADPHLLLFGEKYTPNAHALARRYAVLDNYYSNGDASVWGHTWTSTAIVNDFVEMNLHGGSPSGSQFGPGLAMTIYPWGKPTDVGFDYFKSVNELGAATHPDISPVFPGRGQIFDACARAGVSFRDYGEQLRSLANGDLAIPRKGHVDEHFSGGHSSGIFKELDTARATEFAKDLAEHGLAGFTYIILGTDHTAGDSPGYYTPQSYVADNDAALGRIVEAISHSKYWKDTIIMVTPDDPQSGSDHVDAHRLPGFIVGPMVRRGFVSHTRYSQVSMLHTAELLLGMQPLTLYDAQSTPMFDVIAMQPDMQPYHALPANIPIVMNPGKPQATSFFELDSMPSALQERTLWLAVRGKEAYEAMLDYRRANGIDLLAQKNMDSDEL